MSCVNWQPAPTLGGTMQRSQGVYGVSSGGRQHISIGKQRMKRMELQGHVASFTFSPGTHSVLNPLALTFNRLCCHQRESPKNRYSAHGTFT